MGLLIFIVGFLIVISYVFFFAFNKNEEKKIEMTREDDNIDYDGHGNWGRFPPVKNKNEKRLF